MSQSGEKESKRRTGSCMKGNEGEAAGKDQKAGDLNGGEMKCNRGT